MSEKQEAAISYLRDPDFAQEIDMVMLHEIERLRARSEWMNEI